MRLGVDVGGTNTDAVLMDGRRVAAELKTPTTPDVTSGILNAVGGLRLHHAFRVVAPRQGRAVIQRDLLLGAVGAGQHHAQLL